MIKKSEMMSHEPVDHGMPVQGGAQDVVTLDRKETMHAEPLIQDTLSRLCGLIKDGAVSEARALIHEAQQRWPSSAQVQRWMRLLAPPQARVHKGSSGPSRSQEYAWLCEHAHNYPTQWLALLGNTLLAADPELTRVLAIVRRTGRAKDVLLHFQPTGAWPH